MRDRGPGSRPGSCAEAAYRLVLCTKRGAQERLIRHARFQASAVLSWAVAVIVTSVGTLLMAAVGLAELEAAGFFTAMRTAITLAAVTMTAEIKHRAAGRKVTTRWRRTIEQATGTGFAKEHWTAAADRGRMTRPQYWRSSDGGRQ